MKPKTHGLTTSLSIAALLLSACGEQDPQALLGSAKDYFAKKDSKAAVIQLKSALQRDPSLAEARFLLGRTLLDAGDAVAAEIELRKAYDLKYPQQTVVPLLAKALVTEGQARRATQDYGSVELGVPTATADLKVALAAAYHQLGDTAKATLALDQALAAVHGHAPALLMQARLKAADQQYDAAFALVEQALAREPDNYEVLQFKGELLFFVRGDAAAALEAQRHALRQRSDWLPAHAAILEILLSRNDPAGVKMQLAELERVLPNQPQAKYFRARLALATLDFKTARELAQQLLTIAPDNPKVQVLAAAIELQAGSLAQAENLAAKALQHAPDDASVRRVLAQIYLRSRQNSKAVEILAPMVESPDASVDTLTLAAQAARQAGDAKAAETYFARAAKRDPRDPLSRTALAVALFAKGDAKLAFTRLEEIASTDEGTVADRAIISARIRERDYAAALKAVEAMERKEPGKPFASELRGQIELARGDSAAARREFGNALSRDPLYVPAAASLAALDLRDNNPEQARKHFDKLLAADPKNLQALLASAELRARTGAASGEVAELLTRAVKTDPSAAAPRLLLINLNLNSKDNNAALQAAQEAVSVLPDSAELLDALGRAQRANGDLDQAITSFNKVAALQRGSPQPYLRLADAYLAAKRPAEARRSLARALEIAPKFLPAQRDLVMVELSSGRADQARFIARAIERDHADQSLGYLLEGDVEATQRNWQAAASAYRSGLKRQPSTEIAAKLHSVLLSAQNRAEAEAFADGWLKEHPRDAGFHDYLGDLNLARGDFADAERHYLAVVQLQPENVIALNNLAWVANRMKKPGAAAYAEKANSLRPRNPAFMDTLATILSDGGQVEKAIALEKAAIELAPGFHEARYNLAKFYLRNGDKALAKTELLELAKLGDKFAGQAEVGQLLKDL